MKKLFGSLLLLGSFYCTQAMAYADCWTSYFEPSKYQVAFDGSGLRYIANLPNGVTCGCSVTTHQIWMSGSTRTGSTAATLTAITTGERVRFYLQDVNSDGYCRSSIMELEPQP